MGLTVQNVYGLLLRSRLLNPTDAKALYERWLKEARDSASDVDRFRRWMVSHHYVTDYQAGLLCKGHAVGFFIGEYKILDRLGRGRMAGVYKAAHSTGQIVALKVLPPSKAKVAYLLSRFEREAKLAIQLKHANVVRTFQVGYSDGLHWIAMEYLEGETLDDVLTRRRRLPPNEAVRLIWQALQGVQHIQEKNMVHRDLKPSNIMLTPGRVAGQPDTTANSTLKILDIGLGRMFFDENVAFTDEGEETEEQLTGEGVLLGTPDYLAPEQARSARTVDIRADIYSLGCVLYQCISGQVPYPDTNIITQMIRHAQETPRPLRDFNPDVSDALQQAVAVMMAKDPGQRYQSPAIASLALGSLLGSPLEPARINDDASMSTYLLWLESHPNGAMPKPPKRPGKDSKSGKNRHSKHGSRKKKKKHKEPVAAGVAPPPYTGTKTIDVELVPPPGAEKPAGSVNPIVRWVLVAVGVVAILGAVAAGAVLAFLNTR
jgi:serine/threonine protein kinase